jgi:PAS domain S-box-containing protein
MNPLAGHYNPALVLLSVVIAVLASGAALDLASRVTAATGWFRWLWLAGGAFAMGLGIWSMHYTGMLAFDLPVPIYYHLPTVGISLLAAIAASGVALFVASRDHLGWQRVAWGSLIMGAGIAAMHYIGMAAMRMPATIVWRPFIVGLSIAIAIAVAAVALSFAFRYGRPSASAWSRRKVGTAILMGAAIPAMHYTGMAAALFHAAGTDTPVGALDISVLGAYAIGAGTLVVLAMAIGTALVSRHGEDQLRASEARLRALADRLADAQAIAHVGSFEWDMTTNTVIWSDELRRIFGVSSAAPAGYGEFLALAHPDDRQRLEALVAEGVRTQRTIDYEWRVVRPDGVVRHLQARNVVITNASGKAIRMAGTSLDITDRELTEAELQKAIADVKTLQGILPTCGSTPTPSSVTGSVPIVRRGTGEQPRPRHSPDRGPNSRHRRRLGYSRNRAAHAGIARTRGRDGQRRHRRDQRSRATRARPGYHRHLHARPGWH